MFSLATGKLVRMNSDDSDGEFYRTKSTKLTIGTSLASDCPVGDPSADPATHLAYEICTDEFGRVNIYNKCGAQLLVNGEQVMKKRPLLNDSQILIPNNIRFRWIHSHDVADARDSEFASWSDPGKKTKAKPKLGTLKGRLTTHALHILSSAASPGNDSTINNSRNSGVHSFVDENDENNQQETTHHSENVQDTPSAKKAQPDTQIKSTNDSVMSNDSFVLANESMVSNSSFVLAMSQMTLTSYVAAHNQKVVPPKRESIAYSPQTPQRTQPIVCETPSDAAFQPIDQNENTPNRSTSFAVVKSPTTPTSAGRVRKSMYLIDFTTPQVGAAPSTTGSKSCGRNLLKSAIKNATHQSSATKKMNATVHAVSFDRHFVPETPKSTKAKQSNVFSSTPLMSAKASPKSVKKIPYGDQNVDESSGKAIPTDTTENAARVKVSPCTLFSATKDRQSFVKSLNTSAMESPVATTTCVEDKTPNNNFVQSTQSEMELIEQEASPIEANKSNRISEITNLSAEEEEALLRIDGDAEGADDEFNEDLLLAGSTDDESEAKAERDDDATAPNANAEKHQIVEECDSETVTSDEPQQSAQVSDSPSQVVESIYNDLINDLNNSSKSTIEVNGNIGEPNCDTSAANDPEFSALHASSSSESDIDSSNVPTHRPDDDSMVLSSQNQSNIAESSQIDASIANASHIAQHSESVAPWNDVEWDDTQIDENGISQMVDETQDERLSTDGPNESGYHEADFTNASNVFETSAVTTTTSTDIGVPKELTTNESDSNDAEMSELCGFAVESISADQQKLTLQDDCQISANGSVNDCGDTLQSTTTDLNNSECIDRSTAVEDADVNALWNTLPGSALNDEEQAENNEEQAENDEECSDGIDDRRGTASDEQNQEFVDDPSGDENQVELAIESKYDQQVPTTSEVDAVDVTTAVSTNHIQIDEVQLEKNSEELAETIADEQKENTFAADGDETDTNTGVNNEHIEEQQQPSIEGTEIIEHMEFVSGEEGSTAINELDAVEFSDAEQIIAEQFDADVIDTIASNEQMEVNQEFGDNERLDALIASRAVAETQQEADNADQDAEAESDDLREAIVTETGKEATKNDSIVMERLDQYSGVLPDVAENIEPGNDISVPFATLPELSNTKIHKHIVLFDETQNSSVPESTDVQNNATKSTVESHTDEQKYEATVTVKEMDAESNDLPTDSEIENAEEEKIFISDSDDPVSEPCGAANNESVVVGESIAAESSNGQHFINQVDPDSIESVVSMSSDDNAGRIENIQIEAIHSELTGAVEPFETMEIEFEDNVSESNNAETKSSDDDQVVQHAVEGSDEISDAFLDSQAVTSDLQNRDISNQRNQDNEVIGAVEQIDVEFRDNEIRLEKGNAVIDGNDIDANESVHSPAVSNEKTTSESEQIDETDNCGAPCILISSGAFEPSSVEQTEDKVTESPVLDETTNDTSQSQSSVEEIESSQVHDDNNIVEPEVVIESAGDRRVEAVTIENESGLGAANVPFEGFEARQTGVEAVTVENDFSLRAANVPFEGFEASQSENLFICCASGASEETSVVTGPERIENDHREEVTVEAETDTALEKNKEKMSLVTKNDELNKLNVSDGAHKDENDSDVSTTIEVASNASVLRTPKTINREDVATTTNAPIIHTSDASHEQPEQSEVIPSKSLKDNENVSPVSDVPQLRTPRRKRQAAQDISAPTSARTPRNRQLPARFLESVVYSTPTPKTPRSTRKLREKSVKKSSNSSESIPTEVAREEPIVKQNEAIASSAEDTNEISKLKRQRKVNPEEVIVRKAGLEAGPSTSAAVETKPLKTATSKTEVSSPVALIATPSTIATPEAKPTTFAVPSTPAVEVIELLDTPTPKIKKVPAKKGDVRRKALEYNEPDVEKPKRGRRQAEIPDETGEKEESEEKEKSKRSRRQAPLKPAENAILVGEEESETKPNRGRRPGPMKAPKDAVNIEPIAESSNEAESSEKASKEPSKTAGAAVLKIKQKGNKAAEEVPTPKPARERRPTRKVRENDTEDANAVEADSAIAELPKKTQRKRKHSEEEISSQKPSKATAAESTKMRNARKNVNEETDDAAEEKAGAHAPLKLTRSRKKTVSVTQEAVAAEKEPEQKSEMAKPERTNRRVMYSAADEDTEIGQPPLKKRAVKEEADVPEAPVEKYQPKPKKRTRTKQLEGEATESNNAPEVNANSEKLTKKSSIKSSTEALVAPEPDVRAKRGRAVKDATTEVVAPPPEQKVTRVRKKDQKEAAAIVEKPHEAAVATVAPKQRREMVEEMVVATDAAPKQKASRSRKMDQPEVVVVVAKKPVSVEREIIPENSAAESAPKPKSGRGRKKTQGEVAAVEIPELQQEMVAQSIATEETESKQKATRGSRKKNAAAVEKPTEAANQQQDEIAEETAEGSASASKQKASRGRKKYQPELAILEEDEIAAVTEEQPEAVPKPNSKKRTKAKDEPSSQELPVKRGKLPANSVDTKTEENQPKARTSRQTPLPKDGTQDVAAPSTSSTVRTRSTRSAKK